MDFVVGMVWGIGRMVDPLAKQQIRGSQSIISHKNQENAKKWYGYFCGDF
jgi:hypothetical protein